MGGNILKFDCPEEGNDCYVSPKGEIFKKVSPPEQKNLNQAIQEGKTQAYFRGKEWMQVLPMLKGTLFLKGLQSGELTMVTAPGKSDSKGIFYVGIKRDADPQKLTQQDIVFAISL